MNLLIGSEVAGYYQPLITCIVLIDIEILVCMTALNRFLKVVLLTIWHNWIWKLKSKQNPPANKVMVLQMKIGKQNMIYFKEDWY
jgi:hypothetical protein